MKTNSGITVAIVIGPLLVSLLAFASTAAAEVVYTPANVTLSGNGSIKIDLNHDAITDFVLQSALMAAYCGTVGGGYTGTTQITPTTGDGIVVSHLNFAALLASGIPVDASSTFYNARARVTQLKACGTSSKYVAGYLGLEFQINGHTHYGWAQVNISVHSGWRPGMRTTLIDFAYETIPGRAIRTGQIAGTFSKTEPPPTLVNPFELSTGSQLIAQTPQESSPQLGYDQRNVRYRLVDLGTLGGPNSTDVASPIMNNRGAITGGADTADSDPNAPNCYAPDCFVMHAYAWRKGVLTDLGGLLGGFGSEGNWINDHNQVAGQSLNGSIDPLLGTPAAVAVFWKSNGQIVDLGTLGGNESLAATINNRGQVVGAAANTTPDPFSMFGWETQTRAFLWEKGFMRDLGDLGGPDAFAISINERGRIAGVSYTSSAPIPVETDCGQDIPPQHPFLWEEGTMIDLGTLGGNCGFPSSISGLNNQGQVVGESYLAGDVTAHPFLWDPKTHPHLRDLGTLGGTFGSATGINDASEIVGVASTSDDLALHAFFWSNGVMQDLGTVKGDGCSVSYHINANGQVVGTSGDDCNEVHAFLWQRGGPIMDLNDLVPPGSGLELTAGEFINDRGEIGASGVLPNGDHHAILLIPCDDQQGDTEECRNSVQNETGRPTTPVFLAAESPAQKKQTPSENMARLRARLARRYHISRLGAPRDSQP